MMYCFYWISMLVFLLQLPQGETKSAEACYGVYRECDYYSLECAEDEVIRLGTLKYGLKEQAVCQDNVNHCTNKDECCVSNPTDCSEEFNLNNTYEAYTNCSGRRNCSDIQSPWKLMDCCGIAKTSTYVSLQYECEKVSTKQTFCGGSVVTGTSTELMFRGSKETFDPEKASRECSCRMTNRADFQTVQLTVIDMRLQSYVRNDNMTAECSSAWFQIDGYLSTRCESSINHETDNFMRDELLFVTLQTGEAVEINLSDLYINGNDDSPAMVWIGLQATKEIDVYCREIIPLTTTTTTPTTTTTTVPTTTTTPTTITTSTTTTIPTTTSSTTTTMTTAPVLTTTTSTTTTPTTTTTIPTTTTTLTTTIPTTTTTLPTTTTTPTTTIPTTTTKPSTTTTTVPTTTTLTTTPTITTILKTTPTTPKTTTSVPTTTVSSTTAAAKTVMTSSSTMEIPTTTKLTQEASASSTSTSTTPSTTPAATPTTTTSSTTASSTREQTVSTKKTTLTHTETTAVAPTDARIIGGASKDEQKIALFLAIFVPLAILAFVIALFIVWLCLRARAPRKHIIRQDKLNSILRPREGKPTEKYVVKRRSLDIKPTDSVVFGHKSLPVTNLTIVPNSLPDVYTIPDMEEPNYTTTSFRSATIDDTDQNQPLHIKLGYLGNGSPPQSFYSSISKNSSEPSQTILGGNLLQNNIKSNNVNHVQQNDNQSSISPSETGVIIHVDNTKGFTSLKSTPNGGVYQADSPAVIVPDVDTKGPSESAHVIPGDSPNDYSALYIKL